MKPFNTIAQAWTKIVPWIDQINAMPATTQAFDATFGEFAGDAATTESALLAAREMAAGLGDAQSIKAKIATNGGYLTGDAPPSEIYGHLIWLANQIDAASKNVEMTLQGVAAATTGDDVRSLLTGANGLGDTIGALQADTAAVATKAGDIQDRLFPQIETIAGTATISSAQVWLSQWEGTRSTLMAQAGADYKSWKKKTMPAGESPPTVEQAEKNPSGWSIFGGGKDEAKADYATVVDKITAGDTERVHHQSYLDTVIGLDTKGNQLVQGLGAVRNAIDEIARSTAGAQQRITSIAGSAEDSQLTDPAWLRSAIGSEDLAGLGDDARSFVQQSLVSA